MAGTVRPAASAESPSLSEVHQDPYITISAEIPGTLVRLQRSSLAHSTPEELENSYRHASVAIDRLTRTGRVLLVDMRQAPGRNEPEFDAALRRVRPLVERQMKRIAVLLRSTVGILQMKRINHEDGVSRMLTLDENEALEFLRNGQVEEKDSGQSAKTNEAEH
ncbi:MAG TPA: hypothetical protein PK156_46870 [Polyangium sp.]|nr:hypothetical protein [Polyangium sp.]